ncbi:MAG: phage portal protein [Desulfobacterales bacterium]|nr:phage portal protein [Desulfobacterales bacterium]
MFNKIKSIFFNKRDSRIATTSAQHGVMPLYTFGQHGDRLIPQFSAIRAVEMFKTNPILSGCVNLNSKTVSTIPLKLFAWTGGRTVKQMSESSPWKLRPLSGRTKAFLQGRFDTKPSASVMQKYIDYGQNFVEVEGMHPLLVLLGQGNAQYRQSRSNGTIMTAARITELQLSGNYYMQVRFTGGLPSGLWVCPSEYMVIEPYKTGPKLIKNYWWGRDPHNREKLPPNEIIHGRNYSPHDLYYGQSLVEPAWVALNWLKALDDFQTAIFQNLGQVSVTAGIPNGTKDQMTKFERAYNNKFRGTRNAGRILVYNSEQVKFAKPPTIDFGNQSSLKDSYEAKIEEIAFALGVPISKIKGNDSNLASSYISEQAWMRDTISHICHMDEATLNQFLLPLYGMEEDVFLAYDGIIPKDEEKIEARLISLKDAGIISAEKVREELGFSEDDAPEVPEALEDEPKEEEESDEERKPRGSSDEFNNDDEKEK